MSTKFECENFISGKENTLDTKEDHMTIQHLLNDEPITTDKLDVETDSDQNFDMESVINANTEYDDDIWGNEFTHYNDEAADQNCYLQLPEQIRPVEDYPIILVKFGHKRLVWPGHKLTFEGPYPRFYRCNGEGCYACKGEGKLIEWQLEFFLEMRTEEIVYLAFQKSNKPGSLCAVLRNAFAGGFPAVLSLQKQGMYNYKCSRIQPSPDMDFGVKEIRKFLELLKADKIEFDELVPSVTNAQMLDAAGIGEKLRIMGIRE